VAIADLAHTGTYARWLEEHGLTGIRRRRLGWRFWWGPGMATRLITTTKRRSASIRVNTPAPPEARLLVLRR